MGGWVISILVVGGAGYIGSHMVAHLVDNSYQVLVLDNLSSGRLDLLPDGVELITGDLGDVKLLNDIFSQNNIQAVMHFAAHIEVAESVTNPAKYYQNNVGQTLNLLDVMLRHDVKKFIFSSTAAIFGAVQGEYIAANDPKDPINPYGRSKLMVEQILEDYDRAYNFKSVCLRYFNASGADPRGERGECHDPETHLIPLVLQAASGRRNSIAIFGDDYPTIDGSCVRDYVHVCDLASAHLLAMEHMFKTEKSYAFNLGNGRGYSVKQIIACALEVTGRNIEVITASRRDGDPARLVADSSEIKNLLSWQPQYPELADIISHAWQWELKCQ